VGVGLINNAIGGRATGRRCRRSYFQSFFEQCPLSPLDVVTSGPMFATRVFRRVSVPSRSSVDSTRRKSLIRWQKRAAAWEHGFESPSLN
jgi:hypothetical protein